MSKTAAATGFSYSSTYIKKLAKEGKAGRTPGKDRHQKKGKFGKLDDFNLGVIRRIIHCFYLRNESPTIAKVFKRKMDFPYKKSHLHSLLIELGFKFKRRGMERIIYERDDLVSWREKYLREIAKVRETEPQREIVHMDKTWLNEGHRLQKEWVDLVTLNKANRKLQKIIMRDERLAAQKPNLEKENTSLLPMQ